MLNRSAVLVAILCLPGTCRAQSLTDSFERSVGMEEMAKRAIAEAQARRDTAEQTYLALKRLEGSFKLVSCQSEGPQITTPLPAGVQALPQADFKISVVGDLVQMLVQGSTRPADLAEGVDAPQAKATVASAYLEGAKSRRDLTTRTSQDGLVQNYRQDDVALLVYKIYWDHIDTEWTLDGSTLRVERRRDYGFRFPLDGATKRFSNRQTCEYVKQ